VARLDLRPVAGGREPGQVAHDLDHEPRREPGVAAVLAHPVLRAGDDQLLASVAVTDLAAVSRFEEDLTCLLARYPVSGDVEPGLRSDHLRQIRTVAAASGHLRLAVPSCHGGSGRPAVVQAIMQFVCGYYDVDLRDSTGLGHGRLITRHASSAVCETTR
jgi:alkylation response protein AidB-like acyl-CoA dehydrogenase